MASASAAASTAKHTLARYTDPAVPVAAIRVPAAAGPATEANWNRLEFQATARASVSGGASCASSASRAGRLMTSAEPRPAAAR